MKKTFECLKNYRRQIALSMIFSLLSALCALIVPTVMSEIIDEGIRLADFSYVLKSCALMLGVSVLGLLSALGANRMQFFVTAGFCRDLRAQVFAKVNQMTFKEISQIGTGGLLSRTTRDIDELSWMVSELSRNSLSVPMYLFGGFALSFVKDKALSLIFLAFSPIVFVMAFLISRKVSAGWRRVDKAFDEQNELVRERFRGIRVIRAFGREDYEHNRIEKATWSMGKTVVGTVSAMSVITPVGVMMMNMAALIMAYVGGARMENGTTALGGADLFAMIQYVALASSGILGCAGAMAELPRIKIALERVGEVLLAQGQESEEGKKIPEKPFSGAFELSHVTFRYEGAEEAALEDVSFSVSAGEKVAIIGSTGCGKSTIVQLLLGFYRQTSGDILFDDMNSLELTPGTLRRNISPVLQRSGLFSGTLRENVAMGREEAADEEIREALGVAQILDFVDSLSEGLDTVLEEGGKNLSGGQKQRLCIARALLKRAPIYIFDDSFSALDFMTEAKLSKALEDRDKDKTRLVITQRVSTARRCDRTIVLEKGKVAGIGRHEELLDTCPVYKEIFLSQNKEVSE